MMDCFRVGQGNKRWVMDVRLQCPLTTLQSSSVSRVAVAVGIILTVVCVLIPALLAGVLIHQASTGAQNLSDPDPNSMTATLAYRYADYDVDYGILEKGSGSLSVRVHGMRSVVKHSVSKLRNMVALAWDSLLDMQRLLLAVVAMSVMLHPLHQLLLVLLVMGSYLLMALLVRPWRRTVVSWLQVGALTVLVASTVAMIACNVQSGETTAFASPYKQVLPVLVIVANRVYVVMELGSLLYFSYQEFTVAEKLSDMLDSV